MPHGLPGRARLWTTGGSRRVSSTSLTVFDQGSVGQRTERLRALAEKQGSIQCSSAKHRHASARGEERAGPMQ